MACSAPSPPPAPPHLTGELNITTIKEAFQTVLWQIGLEDSMRK